MDVASLRKTALQAIAPVSFVEFAREEIEQSIPARFERQVNEGPTRVAVKWRDLEITYEELNVRANLVAAAVLQRGGDPGEPAAILIEQGPTLVAAILGVLKAGRPYVPLDPTYPHSRLGYMLEDSGATLIVAERQTVGLARGLAPRAVIDADDLGCAALESPEVAISPDSVAYIYYTSGSTGQPKGVFDSHRNVLHNVMRYTNGLSISRDDRLTLLQRPAFSGTVSSLFGALLNGAAVYPFDLKSEGLARLAAWLSESEITIYHSVPAIYRRVATAGRMLPTMRIIRLEGDQASRRDVELFQTHFGRGCVLVNGLGSTECGIVRRFCMDSTTKLTTATVPVGHAIEDMEVLLLDTDGSEVGVGEIGEIAVRSRFSALGYWRRPDLTGAAFRDHPAGDGRRIYHTGDLGRMDADGCLEHLGRKDFQAKVKGHRVEVEAIETALLSDGTLIEVAVTTREGPGGEARIVAYVVPAIDASPTVSTLRRRLALILPGHTLPSRYIYLQALPLDESGKVCRSALPSLSRGRGALDSPLVGPRSPLEALLIDLWEEILEVGPVGVRDDFEDLGGDSLIAAMLFARLEEMLGRPLPSSVVATSRTVEQLALAILEWDRAGQHDTPIAEIQHGQPSVAPFFYVPSDLRGGALYCAQFARALGPDRPFYAVAPYGLRRSGPPTIEAIAAERLEIVRSLSVHGPYLLGGHCNPGGLVALEMARQLERAGERVSLLALIGTTPTNSRWGLLPVAKALKALVHAVARVLALTEARELELFVALRGRLLKATRLAPHSAGDRLAESPVVAAFGRAIGGYVPKRYRGRVTLLWPQGDAISPNDAARRWRRVARDLDLRLVPGNHITSVTSHLPSLAGPLGEALAQAEASTQVLNRRAIH